MGWIKKEQKTSLDELPIHGLYFLDGDVMSAFLALKYDESLMFNPDWRKGHKSPEIEFPSGQVFELRESTPKAEAAIHLFGEMDLAYRATRNEAFAEAKAIAETWGYTVKRRGEQQLEVWGVEAGEQFILTYDNQERRMVNAARLPEPIARPIHPSRVLMNEAMKQMLSPLSTTEVLGEDALAQVKYVFPDSHSIWYISAFDGAEVL